MRYALCAAARRRVGGEVHWAQPTRAERRRRGDFDATTETLPAREGSDLSDLGCGIAGLALRDRLEHGCDRRGLHPARRTLTALLGLEELRDREGALDHACALFDDRHAAAAEVTARGAER